MESSSKCPWIRWKRFRNRSITEFHVKIFWFGFIQDSSMALCTVRTILIIMMIIPILWCLTPANMCCQFSYNLASGSQKLIFTPTSKYSDSTVTVLLYLEKLSLLCTFGIGARFRNTPFERLRANQFALDTRVIVSLLALWYLGSIKVWV